MQYKSEEHQEYYDYTVDLLKTVNENFYKRVIDSLEVQKMKHLESPLTILLFNDLEIETMKLDIKLKHCK